MQIWSDAYKQQNVLRGRVHIHIATLSVKLTLRVGWWVLS